MRVAAAKSLPPVTGTLRSQSRSVRGKSVQSARPAQRASTAPSVSPDVAVNAGRGGAGGGGGVFGAVPVLSAAGGVLGSGVGVGGAAEGAVLTGASSADDGGVGGGSIGGGRTEGMEEGAAAGCFRLGEGAPDVFGEGGRGVWRRGRVEMELLPDADEVRRL